MNKQHIAESVRRKMPEGRWKHTVGVMETAIKLAHQYGVDQEQAELAAILHDCCKYWPAHEQAEVLGTSMNTEDELYDVLDYEKELWHAPAGAIIASRDYGISDACVIDAIRYHTTGRLYMTQLDKVLCLADYIEPGREYPDVYNIRILAEHSLGKALIAGFDSTIHFLLNRGKKIYPLTVKARNQLIREVSS